MDDQRTTAPGVQFMAEWQSRQAGLAQPATAPVAHVQRGPRPRYVAAALEDECRQVAGAADGTRNGQLNTSALKLGRLVGAGLLEEEEARAALLNAAAACGLSAREAYRTISSGMRAGIADPRDPGEPRNTGDGRSAPLRELTPPGPPGGAVDREAAGTDANPGGAPATVARYLHPAGTWLAALPELPEPLWGRGDTVLWSPGESLMIAGAPGLGKTTLAGQLVRARVGLQDTVLDLPVIEGGHVLYLAMDRPQQIGRRLRQQFSPAELEKLDEKLTLGVGPPPADLARHPELLTELCAAAGADTVVVDSLKDAAIGLVDDEAAAGWNRARQLVLAAGVQVLELHHLVKRGANGKDPDTLADVYGSMHLTAGAGSVLVLIGEAGSPVVVARHLKPPLEPFGGGGPVHLMHDHGRGRTTVQYRPGPLELLAVAGTLTARSAACQLGGTEKPSPGDVERARRALEKLVGSGHAVVRQVGQERRYHPSTARELFEHLDPDTLED